MAVLSRRIVLAFVALFLSALPAAAQSTATFTYDAQGRLVTTNYPSGASTTYSYDPADNRLRVISVVAGAIPIANPVTPPPVLPNTSNNTFQLNITGGTPTSVSVDTAPVHGTASPSNLTILYTPTPGYSGPDTLKYRASNSFGTSAAALVSITVSAAAPIANDVSASVAANSTSNPIAPNITGGAATGLSIWTNPQNGSATASTTTLYYTPNPGFSNSTDTFTYKASNASGTSAPAQVTVTVGAAPPVAGPVNAAVTANTSNNPITLNVTGQANSVSVGTQASHGVATANGTNMTYTPNPGYSGPDSFTYYATGPGGPSNTATVSVTVNSATPELVANVDSTMFERFWTGTTWGPVASINCFGTGGVSPYNEFWEYVSQETGFIIQGQNTSAASWSRTYDGTQTVHQSVWRCRVTDSAGTIKYSPNINVILDQSSGS